MSLKTGIQLVLLAQDDLGGIELGIAVERWPLDPDGGIVPHEAALVVGMVDIVALVAELSGIREHQKAVGESTRDEELTAILSREHHAFPSAIGGTALSKVNRHIEDPARNNAHELRLGMLDLEMQSTQHTAR